MDRIPVAGPWITRLEVEFVTEAVRRGWYGGAGEFQQRFEEEFARYVGVRHAVSLPSCTSAIHLALVASGIGPGDEVIVPESTWIATAAPISYVGATPVFADVDPASWCLDPSSFEACLSPATRAVIPVDLYGGMPDMAALRAIAEERSVLMIEDAAEAVGSEFGGRRAGSFGSAGVFSFHGSKTLTTGEGGMLVTDRDDLHQRVLVLRDHGRQPGETLFRNTEVAFKYKMSALQAALGLAQLRRVDELVAKKRQIFEWYRSGLDGLPRIALNGEPPGVRNAYWMVTIILDPSWAITKEQMIAALAERGVDSRPFFYPLSSLQAYEGLPGRDTARLRNPVSYRLGATGVNLPSALNLEEDQVAQVCTAVREILKSAGG